MSFLTQAHYLHSPISTVDVLLEPQTIYSFINFCASGEFPNDTITNLARPAWDEVLLMTRPFGEWAPPDTFPYDTESESVAGQIMIKLSSNEEACCHLSGVPQHVQSMKSTLWDDLVPISDTQWHDRGLDEPDNFDVGIQYLTAVLAGFDYLNLPQSVSVLRKTFNLVSKELEGFGNALHALRIEEGRDDEVEAVDMAALWGEFIHVYYQLITTRAHSWVISHVKDMRESIMHDLRSDQTSSEPTLTPKQVKLADRMRILAETALVADAAIFLSMDGYRNYSPPTQGNTRLQNPDYATRLDDVRRKARWINLGKVTSGFFGPLFQLIRDLKVQIETQDGIRKDLRGEPMALPPRRWIMKLLMDIKRTEEDDDTSESFTPPKLVIYRLTYKQTDQEWDEFVKRLEADMSDWGVGIEGADEIKDKLELYWVDGKELGIPEGDIDMAKEHYSDMAEGIYDDLEVDIAVDKFLVIDDASFASYTTKDYSLPSNSTGLFAADFKPFVLTVDSRYDPDQPYVRAEEAPGYEGEMRILGSLVWSDFYARLVDLSPFLMWTYAMEHPNQVYTGPTVPLQVEAWRKYNAGQKPAGDASTESTQERRPDHNEL